MNVVDRVSHSIILTILRRIVSLLVTVFDRDVDVVGYGGDDISSTLLLL